MKMNSTAYKDAYSSYRKLFIRDVVKKASDVDDGTGQLECVLWHNESALLTRISDLKKALGTGTLCDESGLLISLLNKVELNEIDTEEKYKPGNMIAVLGILKTFRGKLELNIRHHFIAAHQVSASNQVMSGSHLFSCSIKLHCLVRVTSQAAAPNHMVSESRLSSIKGSYICIYNYVLSLAKIHVMVFGNF
ncbi:uncharacterized protein LOC118203119 isoform X2 [Stegodyphus dumicola]|uniref:uncharacterized protein LOC118203119 isoform X2 n=1 Tax=Stegodyphus dumicola TaxID=202533 RepID=UPI0015AAF91C|nr:uncharacterized protein LOC118203119 isoform X2 [Stegodyphus dumicola]